jgi:hypothetical protein
MLKLTQQDAIDQIWNEAYEIFADMEDLNDEELVECRLAIKGRAKHIMRLSNLDEYRKDNGWL